MFKTTISDLNAFGQSAWLDNINRSMIKTGRLKSMIETGLMGMTSNPTIFEKAITGSDIYDDEIADLCKKGFSTFEVYDELTTRDIQKAADLFKPIYEKTKGLDGYVSLEVNPKLAFEALSTIEEAKRLYKKVDRQNVMFKIPATGAGFKAIEELVAGGININATLIFSPEYYINTAMAYIRGIERFLNTGGDARKVHSVASVFVSRIDTFVDSLLEELIENERSPEKKKKIASLLGKAAVANSARIYGKYLEFFSSPGFKKLKQTGANVQRVLWASTSTKNAEYSDIKYITELIGKDTVNTIPEGTFKAFSDHGVVKEALTSDISASNGALDDLEKLKIDMNEILNKLLTSGVASFEKSFDSLLETLSKKAQSICVK